MQLIGLDPERLDGRRGFALMIRDAVKAGCNCFNQQRGDDFSVAA